MVLNTVSEYCRGLGDIPTYGLAGNRDDVDPEENFFDDDQEMSETKIVSADDSSYKRKGGKWIEAEFDEQDRLSTVSSASSEVILKKTLIFKSNSIDISEIYFPLFFSILFL